jgi:hypothetical protein
VEWLDDATGWKAGDGPATERLREYLTPFVHGVLLARLPHHQANALMPEALDTVMVSPEQVTRAALTVSHAVAVARRLCTRVRPSSQQERPSSDSTIAEGRQWLERVRRLPESVREVVLWRFVEGIPGPELCEVLAANEDETRTSLERGVGETMLPPVSLVGADYLWDLSGEPSTSLARAETWAMALRFDPLAPPEPADVVNTAATFQDLKDVGVETRPEANPFGDFAPTRVAVEGSRPAKLHAAGSIGEDEKTQGGFDLPAAARGLPGASGGLVPKTEPAAPPVKTGGRPGLTIPPPTQRSEPKVAKVFEDDRPSKKRPVLANPGGEEERPSRKLPPPTEPMGRRETREAPVLPTPSQTHSDADEEERPSRKTPRVRSDDDDERPSRSRIPVRGKLERGEESGRKRNPELERGEESARRRNPELDARARRAPEPDEVIASGVTPVGPPGGLEQPDDGRRPMPVVTEKLMPQPVSPAARFIAIGVGGALLLLAVAWRLGLFR